MSADGERHLRGGFRKALRRFSPIMRIFHEAAPGKVNDSLLREALVHVTFSARFTAELSAAATVAEAVEAYKVGVAQELAASVRRWELRNPIADQQDDELLSRFFPASAEPVPAVQSILDGAAGQPVAPVGSAPLRKRGTGR